MQIYDQRSESFIKDAGTSPTVTSGPRIQKGDTLECKMGEFKTKYESYWLINYWREVKHLTKRDGREGGGYTTESTEPRSWIFARSVIDLYRGETE